MKLHCYGLQKGDLICLKQIVKPGTEVQPISRGSFKLDKNDFLMLSTAEDMRQLDAEELSTGCPVFCWDQIYQNLLEQSWLVYCSAEQYYLHYALEKALEPTINTLFLGSSYAKYGLSATEFGNSCVNLGLDAQDMYYTCKLAARAIESNSNIRHVVLASGYYWFYSDISRADSDYARGLIADTYYPILKDAHHANGTYTARQCNPIFNELDFLDEHKTFTYFCRIYYTHCNGESVKITRTFAVRPQGWSVCNRFLLNPDDHLEPNEMRWALLPTAVKDLFAQARCKDHNRLLQHIESYQENTAILNQLITLCNQRNINVYILCMPQTEYYLWHLNPQFKQDYFSALDSVEGTYHFLDFHEANIFLPEDYIDQDHLSPSGAKKATAILKELIQTCGD